MRRSLHRRSACPPPRPGPDRQVTVTGKCAPAAAQPPGETPPRPAFRPGVVVRATCRSFCRRATTLPVDPDGGSRIRELTRVGQSLSSDSTEKGPTAGNGRKPCVPGLSPMATLASPRSSDAPAGPDTARRRIRPLRPHAPSPDSSAQSHPRGLVRTVSSVQSHPRSLVRAVSSRGLIPRTSRPTRPARWWRRAGAPRPGCMPDRVPAGRGTSPTPDHRGCRACCATGRCRPWPARDRSPS